MLDDNNVIYFCLPCRYQGLDRIIRVRLKLQPNSFRFVASKVAADGIIFGPLDLLVFFTYMSYSSGKSTAQVKEDVKRDFLPALILEGAIWPAVQVANFRFVPVHNQLLYVNLFCLLDSCFLSWIEQQQDAPWKRWLKSRLSFKEEGQGGWFLPSFIQLLLELSGMHHFCWWKLSINIF